MRERLARRFLTAGPGTFGETLVLWWFLELRRSKVGEEVTGFLEKVNSSRYTFQC